MCFDSTRWQKSKVATEDIPCWKVLLRTRFGLESQYKGYLYVSGVVQPTIKLRKSAYYEIFQGYHSFHTKERAYNTFHGDPDLYVVKFIIPKGTRYYSNKGRDEYVSGTIIMKDKWKQS